MISHTETQNLNDFFDAYLASRAGQLRTYRTISSTLRRIAVQLPKKPIHHIKPVDIADYVLMRKQSGASNGTINCELLTLSAAINYAKQRWGWPLNNIVSGQYLRWPEGRLRYLTKAEAKQLREQAKHVRGFWQHLLPEFIDLALNTGMRKTEMLELTWDRVRFESNQVVLEGRHTKTAKRRLVPLNQKAVEALRNIKETQNSEDRKSKWVFANAEGNRIKTIYKAWSEAVQRAGLHDFVIHDLRHTFASWLVMNGVSLLVVRDLLGHASIKTTERYAHLNQNALVQAVSVLETL